MALMLGLRCGFAPPKPKHGSSRRWTIPQISECLAGRFATHVQIAIEGTAAEERLAQVANELVLWELFRLRYTMGCVCRALAAVHPKHGVAILQYLRN